MAKVTFLPAELEIEIDETTSIREAAHLIGVNVHDRCGGLGACCSCVVTVVEGSGHINPKTVIEEAVFYLAKDDRLSCQCRITGDVVVKV